MNDDMHKKNEVDPHTGVETTGHEWDGIKELNTPTPRWWLWVLYVTIIWSVGYWIVYPAWPTFSGHTEGTFGWTQHKQLAQSQAEIVERQAQYLDRFRSMSFEQIMADEEIYAFAIAGGSSAFKDNCATCHGTGGAGSKGYPNLNDDDWLWGGSVKEIHDTIRHGVRSIHDETLYSQMPAFGKDELLNREEIVALVDHVVSLSDTSAEKSAKGSELFATNCASCHGDKGQGLTEFGAPDLSDQIWLYGGSRKDIFESIYNSRFGVMPTWEGRLDDDTVRQLSIYVHSLGGGEQE